MLSHIYSVWLYKLWLEDRPVCERVPAHEHVSENVEKIPRTRMGQISINAFLTFFQFYCKYSENLETFSDLFVENIVSELYHSS